MLRPVVAAERSRTADSEGAGTDDHAVRALPDCSAHVRTTVARLDRARAYFRGRLARRRVRNRRYVGQVVLLQCCSRVRLARRRVLERRLAVVAIQVRTCVPPSPAGPSLSGPLVLVFWGLQSS